MTDWKVCWGALFASLFTVSLWRNNRKYKERSRWFRFGKAFMDAVLVSLLATFCPPLLIAYCVLWATHFIPGDHLIKSPCPFVAGCLLPSSADSSSRGCWSLAYSPS